MTVQDQRQFGALRQPTRRQIAFLAISQAHQFLHWLPAALRLTDEANVEVTVLVSSEAGAEFIRSYDPEHRLRVQRLRFPSFRRSDLFTPPHRLSVLLLNARTIARFPVIVTTETTSSFLRLLPGFRSTLIRLMHGAGDREGGYDRKHAAFDYSLVFGVKDKQRLIERELATDENCRIVGYGKFELVRPPSEPLFEKRAPIALYNSHSDKKVGTWKRHGVAIVRQLEAIADWNFVVAPHVKLRGGPAVRSDAAHVVIDRGSKRCIDMTYTQAADVYIGDASSQVYEFIRTPRPCIFLNLDRVDWRSDPAYAHWHLGQVIESVRELPAALARAEALQPQFQAAQVEALARSIDHDETPASERQAQAILEFARRPAMRSVPAPVSEPANAVGLATT